MAGKNFFEKTGTGLKHSPETGVFITENNKKTGCFYKEREFLRDEATLLTIFKR